MKIQFIFQFSVNSLFFSFLFKFCLDQSFTKKYFSENSFYLIEPFEKRKILFKNNSIVLFSFLDFISSRTVIYLFLFFGQTRRKWTKKKSKSDPKSYSFVIKISDFSFCSVWWEKGQSLAPVSSDCFSSFRETLVSSRSFFGGTSYHASLLEGEYIPLSGNHLVQINFVESFLEYLD